MLHFGTEIVVLMFCFVFVKLYKQVMSHCLPQCHVCWLTAVCECLFLVTCFYAICCSFSKNILKHFNNFSIRQLHYEIQKNSHTSNVTDYGTQLSVFVMIVLIWHFNSLLYSFIGLCLLVTGVTFKTISVSTCQ